MKPGHVLTEMDNNNFIRGFGESQVVPIWRNKLGLRTLQLIAGNGLGLHRDKSGSLSKHPPFLPSAKFQPSSMRVNSSTSDLSR